MSEIKDLIFILDERQQTIGVASNGSPFSLPYYSDMHMEMLSGVSTYEFTVPATHPDSQKLRINGHIVRQVYDGSYVLFTIRELGTSSENGSPEIKVFTENTAIGELLEDVKRPSSHSSVSLEFIVQEILSNTVDWGVGYIDYQESRDIDFEEYTTVLEALRAVELAFGVEIYFTVELVGTQITGKKVNVVKERGNDDGLRFEYAYNIQGVSRTEDSSGLITAIVALGKGDSTQTRINLGKVPSFDDGDIYKIVDADWIGSDSALQQWSKDGSHIFGILIDDEADTATRLKTVAINELKSRMVPKVTYSATVRRLEELAGYENRKVSVGDTVIVLDRTFTPPIAITARVKGLEISYTDELESKIDLGNYKPFALSTPPEIAKIQNAISLKEQEWKETGTTCVIESLGGDVFRNNIGSTILTAKVYKGPTEIDLDGTEYLYKWFKYNSSGSLITQWGNGEDYRTGKQIAVSNIDVDEKATFLVKIDELI